MKKEKIIEVAEKIKQVNDLIISIPILTDEGSFNLDNAVIDLTGWLSRDVDNLSKYSGVNISTKISSGIWREYSFISFECPYSQSARTEIHELAVSKLKDLGVKCSVWYHLD